MRLAVRELLRRPGRFAVVGGALALLVLLLLFLGALLDGLYLNSSGAIRAQDTDAIVFSDDARESFLRSSIDASTRTEVESVDGVESVGGLGLSLLGVDTPGTDDIENGAVVGYERATDTLPEPPGPGQAYADRDLGDVGADVGDTVLVGPAEVPLEIVGWVDDSNYLLQYGLWVAPDTWRNVQNANRPDAVVADDEFQVLTVTTAPGADPEAVRTAIDDTTGTTDTFSQSEAVFAIPGLPEQNSTFAAVIGVTLFVVGLVVALFFALLTLERLGLYAVLKAVGATTRAIVFGVIVQSVAVALGAFVVGGLLTFALAQVVPAAVPVQFEPSRAVFTAGAVVVTSVLGALVSLRRIIRIDPASALGSGV
ncbi:MAG: ABC transporter permease [Acidimicrobiia bacterium]|nr:ABC transporter permease [Acidimicrobiia bacterium]